MPSLQFIGERNDVAEYLSARGWRTIRSPVPELMQQYGLETCGITGSLAMTVYVSGTLAAA